MFIHLFNDCFLDDSCLSDAIMVSKVRGEIESLLLWHLFPKRERTVWPENDNTK